MNLDPFYSYNPPSLPFEQLLSVLFTNAWYSAKVAWRFSRHSQAPMQTYVSTLHRLLNSPWLCRSLFASLLLYI